jgi:uncharacterized membrane-anchored protein
MKNKTLTITLFVLVALVQLFVPIEMIWDREETLNHGTEYHFETAPIDPNDPFRGKYVALNFLERSIPIDTADNWQKGEVFYAVLGVNDEGFAYVSSVSRDIPNEADYLEMRTSFISSTSPYSMSLYFPFDRFYVEESKAKPAEQVYFESTRDSTQKTYAVVRVREGKAVLEDVQIDGVSIIDMVSEGKDG